MPALKRIKKQKEIYLVGSPEEEVNKVLDSFKISINGEELKRKEIIDTSQHFNIPAWMCFWEDSGLCGHSDNKHQGTCSKKTCPETEVIK